MTSHELLADPAVRAQLDAHAMVWFPRECCALLVVKGGAGQAILADNLIDQLHSERPEDFERTGVDGYYLDSLEIARSEGRGERLVAIVHSHVRVGAYFSAEDKRQALAPWGEPLFPGVEYVVLDAQDDGVRGYRVFAWSEGPGDFEEVCA